MTITKTFLRRNDDGSPLFDYKTDADPATHGLILTGPIYGAVTTSDGTVYDVSEDVIEAPIAHHGEISHQIGVRHETEQQHPLHQPGVEGHSPFVHACSDHCGQLRRDTSTEATA